MTKNPYIRIDLDKDLESHPVKMVDWKTGETWTEEDANEITVSIYDPTTGNVTTTVEKVDRAACAIPPRLGNTIPTDENAYPYILANCDKPKNWPLYETAMKAGVAVERRLIKELLKEKPQGWQALLRDARARLNSALYVLQKIEAQRHAQTQR